MLKQRIVTALLLLPPALALILFAPPWLFDVAVGFLLIGLAWEYAALCGVRGAGRVVYAIAVVGLFLSAVSPWRTASILAQILLLAAAVLWLLVIVWLRLRHRLPSSAKWLAGLLLLSGAGVALHGLKLANADGRWILMTFVIVWAADVGAYAVGRLWGRHKLAPAISPGKTWEGVAGGIALVLLCGVGAAAWFVEAELRIAWLLLLLPVTLFSVIGDLYESLLKRQAGVKDSGNLLPGHGGLLDRLDSLIAVAPVFLLSGEGIGIFGELSSWGL